MNDVPAAFRRRHPKRPSFIGMDDDRLIKVAATAFHSAQLCPAGSEARRDQWHKFDAAMLELGSRMITHVLEKIHDHEIEQDAVPGDVIDDDGAPGRPA